jgi:hypothetical protein
MAAKKTPSNKNYGKVKGPYRQKSVKKRIEALFLENVGKILSREQIIQAATDSLTKRQPENWHQRLSELRTDDGYTILSWRNRGDLKVQEYVMPHVQKRKAAGKRVRPTDSTWLAVIEKANYSCEWNEGKEVCGLKEGEIDPVGGGRVKLTPDHKNPHSINPATDSRDPSQWQALCGRHQVTKKNYWDNATGKLNAYAIIQHASVKEKRKILDFLLTYFGYQMTKGGQILREKK